MDSMTLFSARPARLEASPEAIEQAKRFVLAQWQARHLERYGEMGKASLPVDLSSSCKFSSLFAQALFGGTLEGNWQHQFVRLPSGQRLDLNEEALDVQALGEDAYRHDPVWWGNRDHRDSLKSCLPRVEAWVQAFEKEWGLSPQPPATRARRTAKP